MASFCFANVLQEQVSIEMVCLVLKDASEQSFPVNPVGVPVKVEGRQGRFVRAADLPPELGHRQASFGRDLDVKGVSENLWVDGDVSARAVAAVPNEHAVRVADLVGGKPNTEVKVHGLNHFGGNHLDVVCDFTDWGRGGFQNGVAVEAHGWDVHRAPISLFASSSSSAVKSSGDSSVLAWAINLPQAMLNAHV